MSTLPDVKVGMIGVSGSGKTWFMTGMFATMCRGVHGFTLNSKKFQQGLRLNSIWKAMVEGGEKRNNPTSKEEDWRFDCCHAYRAILGFTLKDYRGGLLVGDSDEDDIDSLVNYLCECSCIFLMIPANMLNRNLPDYEDVQFTALAITQILTEYAGKNHKKCPIVLMITKSDKLIVPGDPKSTERNFELAKRTLMEQVVEPLFVNNSDWPVFICPVSLGEELNGDVLNGRIDPINIHLPMLYAMSIALKQAIDIKKDEYNRLVNSASNAKRVASEYKSGNAVRRWWYSEEAESADMSANQHMSNASGVKSELERCESDYHLLVDTLSKGRNCYFYYNSTQNISIEELLRRV
ncbi:hypothetical protein GTO89_02670 [Heliobacterium gestii]|uniref:Uncharacterized protein n=1 Tax=Heliomicrobium gestii TaxID=2699 RepID=A0A845L5M9_HELGE|nr:hypothetical protein [Heliomicrobium gestii]MBM7865688.1 hypothetical protein [Heliomicrobium gestii]MZP41937.1 hypothetical protein [Heliomicrobium gestii]